MVKHVFARICVLLLVWGSGKSPSRVSFLTAAAGGCCPHGSSRTEVAVVEQKVVVEAAEFSCNWCALAGKCCCCCACLWHAAVQQVSAAAAQ